MPGAPSRALRPRCGHTAFAWRRSRPRWVLLHPPTHPPRGHPPSAARQDKRAQRSLARKGAIVGEREYPVVGVPTATYMTTSLCSGSLLSAPEASVYMSDVTAAKSTRLRRRGFGLRWTPQRYVNEEEQAGRACASNLACAPLRTSARPGSSTRGAGSVAEAWRRRRRWEAHPRALYLPECRHSMSGELGQRRRRAPMLSCWRESRTAQACCQGRVHNSCAPHRSVSGMRAQSSGTRKGVGRVPMDLTTGPEDRRARHDCGSELAAREDSPSRAHERLDMATAVRRRVVTVGVQARALERSGRGAASSLSAARSASWMLILSTAGMTRSQATSRAGLDMGAGVGVRLSSSRRPSPPAEVRLLGRCGRGRAGGDTDVANPFVAPPPNGPFPSFRASGKSIERPKVVTSLRQWRERRPTRTGAQTLGS
jgi:hypothetical protein